MKLLFNNKFLNIIALIFVIYFAFQVYNEPRKISTSNPEMISTESSYNIKIDGNKKYEDYTLTEKVAYYFMKDKIKAAQNKAMPIYHDPKYKLVIQPNDEVTITYKVKDGIDNIVVPPKTVTAVIGDGSIPPEIENILIGARIDQKKTVHIDYHKIEPSAPDIKVNVQIKVEKINGQ